MSDEYLKIDNQLCFPLYVTSKEIIRKYREYLDPIDLTYTQYIVMLVLWEEDHINVKTLGEKLYLDSGTLTPLLKKLEDKGFITKTKNMNDERNQIIMITEKGKSIKNNALDIPINVGNCFPLTEDEAKTLYNILHKILDSIK